MTPISQILKYPLLVADVQEIEMHMVREFLDVQVQYGVPCLWVRANTTSPKEKVTIRTFGTGHDAFGPSESEYLGTYQLELEGGRVVFHVYTDKDYFFRTRDANRT